MLHIVDFAILLLIYYFLFVYETIPGFSIARRRPAIVAVLCRLRSATLSSMTACFPSATSGHRGRPLLPPRFAKPKLRFVLACCAEASSPGCLPCTASLVGNFLLPPVVVRKAARAVARLRRRFSSGKTWRNGYSLSSFVIPDSLTLQLAAPPETAFSPVMFFRLESW